MKKLSLITLDGIGEKSLFLVPEYVIEWIESPPPDFTNATTVKEPIPDDVVDHLTKEDAKYVDDLTVDGQVLCPVTIGSYENDRALHVDISGELSFNTIKDVMNYLKDNNIELSDLSYDGHIY